jgi:radical SAM protein with 4Fe4S-binding SPASM domain
VRQFYFFRYISDNSRNEQLKLNGDTLFETTKMIIGIKNRYLDASFYYEKIGLLSFLVDKGERSAKCNFTKGIITIKYDGTVVVCAAISKNLGNIYYDSLEKIYANIALEINKIEDIPVECKSCSYSKLCKGGCKSSAYSNYASYGYKDECCFKEAFLYSSRL